MPEKYAVVDDEIFSIEGFKFVPVNNYLLFYIVRKETQTVVIQRFIYARRDWINILGTECINSDQNETK